MINCHAIGTPPLQTIMYDTTSKGAELRYDLDYIIFSGRGYYPHFTEISTFSEYYPHFVDIRPICSGREYYPHFTEILTLCGY